MICILLGNGTLDDVGLIPHWLDEEDPRPATEQLDEHYAHGGGWRPFPGFALNFKSLQMSYPGDPPMFPLAIMRLRKEMILVYPHAWVVVIRPNRTYEVCRMD